MACPGIRLLGLGLLLALQVLLGSALAQDLLAVPKLVTRVTDSAGILSADQRSALEAQLAAIEQRKGSQVAVLVVPSTLPEPIEDYSIRVVEAWKLGRAQAGGQKVDDGVLLLVAIRDRKLRIEVGRGLEGAIPDAIAKRIITESIAPKFRQGDFAGGIAAGVTEIGRLIEGEALPPAWHGAHDQGPDFNENWVIGIVVMAVIGLIASAIVGRFFSSIGAGTGAGIWSLVQGMAIPVAAVSGIGLFLAVLFLASMRGGGSGGSGRSLNRGRGGSGPIWTSGGGGSSSSSSGSSDSGFSGGGGDFGGGGSSGDW